MAVSITTGPGPGEAGFAHCVPTEELWRRLARPFDVGEVAEVLLGIPADVITQLADVVISTGEEATVLLETMPTLLRRLRMGSNDSVERSASGVRGPVLWAETVAARSSSFGHTGVYVCSVPGRDYDVIENRLLVAALKTLVQAGGRVRALIGPEDDNDELASRALINIDMAAHYLGHRALAQVRPSTRTGRRSLRSMASGRGAAAYRPAVALLEKAAEPLEAEELMPFCDRSTRMHHRLLLAAMDALESRGSRLPGLRTESGTLIVGPFDYVSPRPARDGSPRIALLRGRDLVIALDPARVGVGGVDAAQVGCRRLVSVSTPVEVTKVVNAWGR